MTWRFIPAFENNNTVIIRDTDSFLNIRDKAAVDEWLASDKKFHIIRDNQVGHTSRIMGGMWGVRNGLENTKKNLIKLIFLIIMELINFVKQSYLSNIINDVFIHDDHEHFIDEKNVHKLPKTQYTGYIGEIKCYKYENIESKYSIKLDNLSRN